VATMYVSSTSSDQWTLTKSSSKRSRNVARRHWRLRTPLSQSTNRWSVNARRVGTSSSHVVSSGSTDCSFPNEMSAVRTWWERRSSTGWLLGR